MKFDQAAFNTFILENRITGFFQEPVKLKSGRTSSWYVNWRNVAEDVFLMERLSEFVLSFISGLRAGGQLAHDPDTLYGVPEGATKLGIICQYRWAKASANFGQGSHVLAMGRAKAKEHGDPKDRFFVGAPRGRTVVIEDVTTTGGSLLQVLDSLLASGIAISAAIGLTNRMERRDDGLSVAEAVGRRGLPYFHMSSALDLLPLAYRQSRPGEAIGRSIEAEFREYGVAQLQLV